ncbi:hypothetical protein [Cytobacillus praedii]|uniref:hypothetical protein n=1 Tax=Cytobacillus praedii TaxID=1742358 RepID=UPI002E1FEA07|nr:hypothetical protein [Cytobacillus praedii]
MEIVISGVGFGLFCIGLGLALKGYYIGKGLQNFRKPAKEIDYFTFLKESDLGDFFNLNSHEINTL